MNYSIEYIADKIAEYLTLIEEHEATIRRFLTLIEEHEAKIRRFLTLIKEHEATIRRLWKSIAQLKCQPVINEEGEVVSYSDLENDC